MENFEENHNLGNEKNFGKDDDFEQEGLGERALDFSTAEGIKGKAENYAIEFAAAKKPIITEAGERQSKTESVKEIIEDTDTRIRRMLDSSPRIKDHINRLLIEKNEIASRNLEVEEKDKLIEPINKKIGDYYKVLSEQYIQADEQEVFKRAFTEDQESEKVAQVFERIFKKDIPDPKTIADPLYKYRDN